MIEKTTLFYKTRIFLIAFLFFTVGSYSQTEIASQSFDSNASGYLDNLNYTVSNANVQLDTYNETGPNSLRFGADSNALFDNVNITAYNSVTLTISFASLNANNGKNLLLDISYDNGSNWEPEIKLIDGLNGGGGQDWNWGTPDNDGGAVSTNPYVLSIPNIQNQVRVRVRGIGALNRYLYIDTIIIQGTLIASGPEINVTDNDGTPTNILDGDNTPTVAKSTDFGDVFYNSGNNPNSFIIENNGTENLTVTSISSDNPTEFAVTGTTFGVITPGNSITFTITFDPTTIGTKTAVITILSNDVDEATYTFQVEGVGVDYCTINFTTNVEPITNVTFNPSPINNTTSATIDGSPALEDFKTISTTDIESIVLYNSLGQLVNSWKRNLKERFISLPVKTATGVYFVQINTANGVISKKILIQ
tara:strand:+ start:301 stop:1560 length:1260 start_codon:yes stop_codon:yes gene_type:complete